MRTILLVIIPALTLAACASGAGPNRHQTEIDRLAAECRTRGGILVPLPGPQTGRAAADHACQINGGATRIERN